VSIMWSRNHEADIGTLADIELAFPQPSTVCRRAHSRGRRIPFRLHVRRWGVRRDVYVVAPPSVVVHTPTSVPMYIVFAPPDLSHAFAGASSAIRIVMGAAQIYQVHSPPRARLSRLPVPVAGPLPDQTSSCQALGKCPNPAVPEAGRSLTFVAVHVLRTSGLVDDPRSSRNRSRRTSVLKGIADTL